ncbi:MAG: decarboxylating 6-phosphogluconate dehydrogenase [Actinomycetota bacterium]|nr:decarboxylating 6-phosphogluconate dehydrogenase [Actinomycetota bacterium]
MKKLAMIGLGKMGGNMAERLRRHDVEVVGYDAFAVDKSDVPTLEAAVGALGEPGTRIAWAMVPAGAPTDQVVADLGAMLGPGDIVIDGGNSHYEESIRRAGELAAHGIGFIDCGTSGGVWGLENGYCLMVGGRAADVAAAQPIFDALAPDGGFAHVGPVGSGHYTKMVHNGIEYGIMQAYGEGFDILHAGEYDLDLAAVARMWNNGSVIRSWLLDLAGNAFEKEGNDLANVHGWVADSGEGRWTVAEAIDHDVPAPIITLSLIERFRSRREPDSYTDRVLAALRNEFGGHAIKDRG